MLTTCNQELEREPIDEKWRCLSRMQKDEEGT
jgi:hypothetical protein